MKIHALLALLISVFVSGCSTLATHPSLRDGSTGAELLAPLVPVRSYVADWDGSGLYQISPDGQQLMWMARVGLGPGVFVKNLQTGQLQSLKTRGYPQWAQDSRHILLMADQAGDENAHIYQFDSQQLDAPGKDLTPFAGASSAIQTRIEDSADLLITSNRRDPKVFDLYRYTQATAEFTLLAQNPGDVARWLTSDKGQLLGRVRKQAQRWAYEALDASATGGWREVFGTSYFDTVHSCSTWRWRATMSGLCPIAVGTARRWSRSICKTARKSWCSPPRGWTSATPSSAASVVCLCWPRWSLIIRNSRCLSHACKPPCSEWWVRAGPGLSC